MKLIFALTFASTLISCSIESPVSGTFCYQKDIGYNDLQNHKYEKYSKEWKHQACKSVVDGDCSYFDHTTTIKVEECVDGTFTEK